MEKQLIVEEMALIIADMYLDGKTFLSAENIDGLIETVFQEISNKTSLRVRLEIHTLKKII